LSGGLAADAQTLGNLKMEAGKSSPQAIKETAKQFESLFMRELIKSMREASPKSGMLDNAGSDLGTDLLDQQFAVQMSGQPGGLSDLIAQQLTRQSAAATQDAAKEAALADEMAGLMPVTSTLPTATPPLSDTFSRPSSAGLPNTATTPAATIAPARAAGVSATAVSKTARPATSSQADFVKKHSDTANRIEKASGIPASYMLGQAGHETGWGKFEIKQKGGAPSFNLFGIKAGAGWTGKTAEVTTTEYVNGVAKKQVAKFRAYDSYEDSFKDYAKLISESPRYAKAKAQTGSAYAFASGLQKAGYATDPDYALKLSRAINTTQQLRRVQV
jgi:flagellar protein FlgJ